MANRSTLGTTAQFKKFSVTMRMLQHIAQIREGMVSGLAHLDAVQRFLLESLDINPDEHAPPLSSKPPRMPDLATTLNPKWDAKAFAAHVLKTYKDSTTESERFNVRALVERGVGGGLLTEAEATDLLARLK